VFFSHSFPAPLLFGESCMGSLCSFFCLFVFVDRLSSFSSFFFFFFYAYPNRYAAAFSAAPGTRGTAAPKVYFPDNIPAVRFAPFLPPGFERHVSTPMPLPVRRTPLRSTSPAVRSTDAAEYVAVHWRGKGR
jgi:hypothetical protein